MDRNRKPGGPAFQPPRRLAGGDQLRGRRRRPSRRHGAGEQRAAGRRQAAGQHHGLAALILTEYRLLAALGLIGPGAASGWLNTRLPGPLCRARNK